MTKNNAASVGSKISFWNAANLATAGIYAT